MSEEKREGGMSFPSMSRAALEGVKSEMLKDLMSLGEDVRERTEELVAFTVDQAKDVAMAVGTDDLREVMEYAKSNVALFAGIEAIDKADEVDRKLMDILFTGLNFIASALSGKTLGSL